MNKEQTKKIMLGGLGLIALIYVYFAFFIGPLNHTRADIEERIVTTQNKTASSKADIEKARKIETNSRASLDRIAALRAVNPEGAPIAWFPPRLKTFFGTQHVDHVSTHLESTVPSKEKELEKWQRYTWMVDVPRVDYHVFGRALAELENSEPLLAITKLKIHAAAQEPELQQVGFTAVKLIESK